MSDEEQYINSRQPGWREENELEKQKAASSFPKSEASFAVSGLLDAVVRFLENHGDDFLSWRDGCIVVETHYDKQFRALGGDTNRLISFFEDHCNMTDAAHHYVAAMRQAPNDLLACPFCGETPQIASYEPYRGAFAEFALPDWKISCACGVTFKESGSHWEPNGVGTIDDSGKAKLQLAMRWNTRKQANDQAQRPPGKRPLSATKRNELP